MGNITRAVLICLLVCGGVLSCSELYEPEEVLYRIPKDKHASKVVGGFPGEKVRTLKRDRLRFTVRFDETARYELLGNDQQDINKLLGFSLVNSFHHRNSVRLGWRYELSTGDIDLFSYVYLNGVWSHEFLGSIVIGETVECEILMTNDTFTFMLKNEVMAIVSYERGMKKGIYYMLFPYFGGNQPAPHDINVFIKTLP